MMSDVRESLAVYLRQRAELDMPDHIFSAPIDLTILQPELQPDSPSEHAPEGAAAPPSTSAPSPVPSVREPRRVRRLADLSRLAGGADRKVEGEAQSTYTRKREALKKLFFEFKECHACPLGSTRKRLVFGAGTADASLLVIGEAPGADEDAQGLPFVGKAGQLLSDMLKAIHLDRKKDTFITNILKCRPPRNRDPESSEILACMPVLKRQIEIIEPKAILLLGRIAAHSLLQRVESIGKLRAEAHSYNGVPVVVTYHPAALLRQEQYKRQAWEDLQKLEKILRERGVDGSRQP